MPVTVEIRPVPIDAESAVISVRSTTPGIGWHARTESRWLRIEPASGVTANGVVEASLHVLRERQPDYQNRLGTSAGYTVPASVIVTTSEGQRIVVALGIQCAIFHSFATFWTRLQNVDWVELHGARSMALVNHYDANGSPVPFPHPDDPPEYVRSAPQYPEQPGRDITWTYRRPPGRYQVKWSVGGVEHGPHWVLLTRSVNRHIEVRAGELVGKNIGW